MRFSTLLGLTAALLTAQAHAGIKVFKHDQFSEDLTTAAQQVQQTPLATQPGFAGGEAFGQLYVPAAGDYPITILGIDLILAAPPNAPGLTTHADIEIWNDDSVIPQPSSEGPVFTVSTTELLNPLSLDAGFPLQGNVAMQINFDYDTPDAVHPPQILNGNVRVMIRYKSPATEMTAEWGTAQCGSLPAIGFCGCQNVGLLIDQTPTPNANLLNHVSPLGKCTGPTNGWVFMETISVTGDVIMRMRAEVSGSGCTADCAGKACGPDGCGGSCGDCGAGQTCSAGACQGVCAPDCAGKACGPDGCGSSCGTCAAGKTCTDGQCDGGCAPDCAGKACGPDGCGGSCGDCGAGQTCSAGACQGTCAPDCAGKVCGPDGCGATCGTCAAGQACSAGQCAATCTPDCAGKTCGPDGCNGVCGTCTAGQECAGGGCIPTGGTVKTLSVTGISPSFGYDDAETAVSITGTGFVDGMTAKLGGTALDSVQVVGDSILEATVPAGLEPTTYLLVVLTPDQHSATLLNAFEVRHRAVEADVTDSGPTCGDGLCQASESCATCPGDCGSCNVADSGCSSSDAPLAPLVPIGALVVLLCGLAALRRERSR